MFGFNGVGGGGGGVISPRTHERSIDNHSVKQNMTEECAGHVAGVDFEP